MKIFQSLCYFTELEPLPGALVASSAGGVGFVVQAVLQALKLLVTCPMSRQEKSRGAWRSLLRSALSTLLGLWESGRDHHPGWF